MSLVLVKSTYEYLGGKKKELLAIKIPHDRVNLFKKNVTDKD